jgi:hypothetical protein
MYVLRFFFEWGGSCLWAADDAARARLGYPVELSKLPIPEELRADLLQAEERFQTWYAPNDPAGPTPWTEEECEQFDELTDNLLARLRDALGSTFKMRDERLNLRAKLRDNPAMQRTGAEGILSGVRKWFGRGSGR